MIHGDFWSFPIANRWHNDYGWILACEGFRPGLLYLLDKVHWSNRHIVFRGKMAASPRPRCAHAHAELFITFDPKGVKRTHNIFQKDCINSLGGVLYKMCKSPKMSVQFKMADFLSSIAYGLKRLFCGCEYDTYVHHMSYMSMKVGPRATV